MLPGVQLYSVADKLAEDARSCVARLAQIGFRRAEGFDLIQLKSIKPLLDEHGIKVTSSFLFWTHITQRYDLAEKINYPWMPSRWGIEHEIDLAHELGLSNLVHGYLLPEERQSLDDYKRLAERLDRAGEACRIGGLKLAYHNHTFEFEPLEGEVPYEILQSHTQSNNVSFELDVLWCQMAGIDPCVLMQTLGSRLLQLHLKTGRSEVIPLYNEKELPFDGHDMPLGEGDVDIAKIVTDAHKLGIDELYIEQEFSKDIFKSLARSYGFLRAIQKSSQAY